MRSGYVGTVDGPWACYVCAVFGDTAKGWLEHGEAKHPVRVMSHGDSQQYFWTKEWQEGEREADEDLRLGRTRRFSTVDNAIAWLNDPEGSS